MAHKTILVPPATDTATWQNVRHKRQSLCSLPDELLILISRYALVECPRWNKTHDLQCRLKATDGTHTETPPFLQTRIHMCHRCLWRTTTECRCAKRKALNLLLTCRKINSIASPIFWSTNTFCFLDAADFTATVEHQLRTEPREQLQFVSLINPDVGGFPRLVTGFYTTHAYQGLRLAEFWASLKLCKNLQTLDMPVTYLKISSASHLTSLSSELPHFKTLKLNYFTKYTSALGLSKKDEQTVFVRCTRTIQVKEQEWSASVVREIKRELDTNFYVHVNTAVITRFLGASLNTMWNYANNWSLAPGLHQESSRRRVTLPTGETIIVQFYGLPIDQKTRMKLVQQKMELERRQKEATGSTVAQHKVELEQAQRKREDREFKAEIETAKHEQVLVDRRVRRLGLIEADRKSEDKKKKKLRKATAKRITEQQAERKRNGRQDKL